MKLYRAGRDDDSALSCRQVAKVLQAVLDDESDGLTVAQVESHLELCRRCGMESAMYRQIKDSLSRSGGRVPEITVRRLRNFSEQLTAGGRGPS